MRTRQEMDEGPLLRRIAAQEPDALGLLYDRYAPVVYALCLKTLGSPEDAEEVVTDVFAQVWRTASSYDPARGRADAWLFRIARSRAVDKLRRRGREARMQEAVEAAGPAEEVRHPESDVLQSESGREMAAALGQLPEAQRRALELAYYQGLSHAEIAEATGEALGTVKTRIRLGLGKLREALAPWWKE